MSTEAPMIDLHSHLLPWIDDGAEHLDMALEMARVAAADGIGTVVCTPHIYPGLYNNSASGISIAVTRMQRELDEAGIALRLEVGADVHLARDLVRSVAEGRVPTLAGSRYLLLEPPHHSAPPGFEDAVFELMTAGLVPVITHPERLSWVHEHYDVFERLTDRGAWMQVTAGALTGRFGRRVRYWGERFVGEGRCHILATDAHHPERRPPLLAEAREAAERLVGRIEAENMVRGRPQSVLDNGPPDSVPLTRKGTGQLQPAVPHASALSRFLRGLRGARAH
ncbi:tyrosine-protein phosphatase [Cognatilysobacter bugurensis]|uniref:protein-tyrosine-phosphatase n=1 Tax=Cognatilysobacter bugurensis TaxID=543356 RepID=A0A918W514_9GAMM|nr:CpsB/CapC family capsule biosynthesis tyrosine phosphatase [Lysobacter bugurensis]GHA72755.1 capsular polysaccharide biosynthesis protein [Lysobacter bugurensis]